MGRLLDEIELLMDLGKWDETKEKVKELEESNKRYIEVDEVHIKMLKEQKDEIKELEAKVESLNHDLASQIYMGNSIGYIYNKMKAYGKSIDKQRKEIKRLEAEVEELKGRLEVKTAYEKTLIQYSDENKRLREGLEKAIQIIKIWHDLNNLDLDETVKIHMWNIYYSKSPEMLELQQLLEESE